MELGGDAEAVSGHGSSVEIRSVTRRLRARNSACLFRPDARPVGDRAHRRFDVRRFSSRRSRAHPAHLAGSEPQTPQNTATSPQPAHRPNRPSKIPPLLHGAAGRPRRPATLCPSAGALVRARREGSGVPPPGPSPSPTSAIYVVSAGDVTDDVDRSRAREFVRFPRAAAGDDTGSTSTGRGGPQVRIRPCFRCTSAASLAHDGVVRRLPLHQASGAEAGQPA